ncbi:DUF397 domain-containing protein [Streptomyces anulatus]|uniref:DUF397 domain-containing protein n=1 Tax=Streptomyces TaxID=1883 RepID=UPI0009967D25|nr:MULTISPECIES: DUF397 domain-containing protein [Streptomyces]MCX4484896.1 DUF397 domain-containing protein [Streptomyces anulatus]MCX4518545.1 DUF397 domain-containing protein [Streptomyces anulatus]WSI77774.1 DUF397 domain-containing protein [Streptomyces anulatus]
MPSTSSSNAQSWFKSSHSGGNTTECVEAAHLGEATAIRDSKAAEEGSLLFQPGVWGPFVSALQDGSLR